MSVGCGGMESVTTWDAAQAQVLAHTDGPLLVLGGPGTGKTTLIAELAARRLATGTHPPALVLCSSRQAASQLRDAIVRDAHRTTVQPAVMTLHAWCLALLQRWAEPDDPVLRLLTAPEQEFRIREILRGRGVQGWPDTLQPAVGTRGFAMQVRAAWARARQLGLDPMDLVRFGAEAHDSAWQALGAFTEEYLDVLDAEGALDYAELVHRARILLDRPDVVAEVQQQQGPVYVDDFSEMDAAQLALLRAMVGPVGTMIAFADPDSAIYRFRGAHRRSISEYQRLFDGPIMTLGHNYRVPSVLNAATHAVARRLGMTGMDAATLSSYRTTISAHDGGRIDVLTFPDELAQAERIAGIVRAAHLEEGMAWGDIAVLIRSGRERLALLARSLTDAGIPVEIAGDDIGLASEPAVRPLLLALHVVSREEPPTADETVELLTSGWGGIDAVALRTLGRSLMAATGHEPGLTGTNAVAEVLAGQREIPDTAHWPASAVKAAQIVSSRRDLLGRARAAVDQGHRPDEVLWLLWDGTDLPGQWRQAALSGGDDALRAHRHVDAVVALFELGRESGVPGGAVGVDLFLGEVAAHNIPADTQREAAVTGRGVRLLTAHRAKGQQWPLVIVADVQEGRWPDVRRRGSVFDPERLSTQGLVAGTSTGDLIATERRLFYLACTRACARLVVTAVDGTDGDAGQPSRFLAELNHSVQHEPSASPHIHTLRQLVASLRAAAQDDDVSPALREAAVYRLAQLSLEQDEDGYHFAPEANPAHWWGMLSPSGDATTRTAVTLSPSQLEALLTCPRQYFCSREAKADPPKTSSMVLGSLLHTIIEHAPESLDLDVMTAYLDQIWPDIPFEASWFAAVERAEAQLALARFVAWQNAHAGVEVVGVEVPFKVTIEVDQQPVTIRGTVDRLERDDATGGLRVVDFKSTRRKVTGPEARSSDQLGLYQLAIEAGAFADLAEGCTTSAGGALVLLRHGKDDYPTVLGQPSLAAQPYLSDDPAELAYPTWVHHRIAQAAAILTSGEFPATPGKGCDYCAFSSSCPAIVTQVIS